VQALQKDTYLITCIWNKKRLTSLRPVARALGRLSCFPWSPHNRPICYQGEAVHTAGTKQISCGGYICILLSWSSELTLKVPSVERFVCQLYEPTCRTTVVHAGDRRWKLIAKKQLQAQKLSFSFIWSTSLSPNKTFSSFNLYYTSDKMWMQEDQLHLPLFLQVSASQLFWDAHMWCWWRGV